MSETSQDSEESSGAWSETKSAFIPETNFDEEKSSSSSVSDAPDSDEQCEEDVLSVISAINNGAAQPKKADKTLDFSMDKVLPPEPDTEHEFVRIKLVMMGDGTVGKSTLLRRFETNKFKAERNRTVQAEVKQFSVRLPCGQKIHAEIYDTAGQEQFAACTKSYFRGADGAMLVYDSTNQASFEKLGYWRQSIADMNTIVVGDQQVETCVVQLVCNKMDLYEKKEANKFVYAQWMKGKDTFAFSKDFDCLAGFFQCRATEDNPKENIDNMFLNLFNAAYQHKLRVQSLKKQYSMPTTNARIKVGATADGKKKGSCCGK